MESYKMERKYGPMVSFATDALIVMVGLGGLGLICYSIAAALIRLACGGNQ